LKPMSGMGSSLSCCRNNKTDVTNNPPTIWSLKRTPSSSQTSQGKKM